MALAVLGGPAVGAGAAELQIGEGIRVEREPEAPAAPAPPEEPEEIAPSGVQVEASPVDAHLGVEDSVPLPPAAPVLDPIPAPEPPPPVVPVEVPGAASTLTPPARRVLDARSVTREARATEGPATADAPRALPLVAVSLVGALALGLAEWDRRRGRARASGHPG